MIKYLLILLLVPVIAMPVELLVHLKKEHVTVDEGADGTIIQTRGSIAAIKPDGWPWGGGENFPTYVVIRVPNVTVAQAEGYNLKVIKPAVMDSLRALYLPKTVANGLSRFAGE